MTKKPPLLCRWFGHSYPRFEMWLWDPVFGGIWVRCCRRCNHREVLDQQEYNAYKEQRK